MSKLVVWASVLVVAYLLLVELPAPNFVVHSSGGVLITGASSGIGLDGAIALLDSGFTVFAGVRKESDKLLVLAECNAQLGSQGKVSSCKRLIPVILDVTDVKTLDSTIEIISKWMAESGQLFVGLVNNAGISNGGVVELTPLQTYRDVMEVNFFGLVTLTQKLLPLIRASKGRIINVSSIAGVLAAGSKSAYSSSKFALEGFTDSIRKELRALGVSVSLVNPGFVTTKITDKGIARAQNTKISAEMTQLYGRYYYNEAARIKEAFATGSTTHVTNVAIVDAMTSSRPSARYFVAGAGKFPASVIAFVTRVLPTSLTDRMVESATAANAPQSTTSSSSSS